MSWLHGMRYGDRESELFGRDSPSLERIIHTLGEASAGSSEEVGGAIRQWQPKIRRILERETGLKAPKRRISVTVSDCIPAEVLRILERPSDQELALFLRLRQIVSAAHTLPDIEPFMGELVMSGGPDFEGLSECGLGQIGASLGALSDYLESLEILESILRVPCATFGCYRPGSYEVEIYWIPLVLIARALGESTESATVKVLAHELAHAWTHAGRDLSQREDERDQRWTWGANDFLESDLGVVEGLANFYALRVVSLVEKDLPGALRFFEALLERQGKEYSAYMPWEKRPRAGELVRHCLIRIRAENGGVVSLRRFEGYLDEIENLLV